MKTRRGARQNGSINLTSMLIAEHVLELDVEAISSSARTAKTQT
jgi:hypothetical protein